MWEKIWEAISSSLPVGVVAVLLIGSALVVATWKVKTVWDRFTAVEKKVTEHDAQGKSLTRIERNVSVLLAHFVAKREIDAALITSESPLRVTSLGNELLEKSGFVVVFPTVRAKIIEGIAVTAPHSKLDLENSAIQSVYVLLGEPEMTPFKNWLYENPQFKASETVTVTTNELLTTAGVYVRDRLLEDEELMKKWQIT